MSSRDIESKRTRAKKNIKTILQYPIFKEIADIITDETWHKTYLDMANGYFPISGLTIQDNRLIYRGRGQKKSKYEIEIPDNVVDAATAITEFLYDKLSINRGIEQVDIQDYLTKHMKDTLPDWGKLKRIQKIEIVIGYARKLRDENRLDNFIYENLKSTLVNAVEDYSLKNEDIVFNNGIIENIKSLSFDEKTKTFNIVRKKRTVKKSADRTISQSLLDRLKMVLYYCTSGGHPETATTNISSVNMDDEI